MFGLINRFLEGVCSQSVLLMIEIAAITAFESETQLFDVSVVDLTDMEDLKFFVQEKHGSPICEQLKQAFVHLFSEYKCN